MEYLIASLVFFSVAFLVYGVGTVAPGRAATIRRRLANVHLEDPTTTRRFHQRRAETRAKLEALLEDLGERVPEDKASRDTARGRLDQAGYRGSSAPAVFYGLRVVSLVLFGGLMWFLAYSHGYPGALTLGAAAIGALAGWRAPSFVLARRVKRRQRQMSKALADALDLLVVCVEAGMGINQALLRVSQEIAPISQDLAEELAIVNLEIQAGTPRDEALRHLADRTGLADVKSLVAMLVQTDRFGTSVTHSLRTHADTLRTTRRQRAEEQAAKTSIKMIFPLAFFVFPALFVVIIAPAILHFLITMKGVS